MINFIPPSIQECYNKIHIGLQNQQWNKSLDINGIPRYRGINNCKCPIGILIPDEHYNSSLERFDIVGSLSQDDVRFNFFRKIQRLHYGCTTAMFKRHIMNVASEYDLTIPGRKEI